MSEPITTRRRGRPPSPKSARQRNTEKVARYRKKLRKEREAEAKLAPLRAKRERRAELERLLAERAVALAADLDAMPRYGVIYADPPWRFEPWSRETGMDRAADNHYATMDVEAIRALPVPAAPDCVLFLWATVPMKPQALEVMAAWGFTYKSTRYWVKDQNGTGYWFRNRVEELLVGTRGNVPAPAPGEQLPQIVYAPRGRHSEKPDGIAEDIETMYPNTPKLEMFARGLARPGWERWGNEVEGEGAQAAGAAG